MKTGLFRDSFLEDPWRDLVPTKTGLRPGSENTLPSNVPRTVHSRQGNSRDQYSEDSGKMGDGETEGEIALPDSDDEDTDEVAEGSGIGLGDGLVEAVRNITN